MPNDDHQPAPAAARDFAAEIDAAVEKTFSRYPPEFRESFKSYGLWVYARGLRRAAEKLREKIETHPDGPHKETIIDAAVNRALDAAADELEREAGAA